MASGSPARSVRSGFKVVLHGDYFAPGTPVTAWLRDVGRRRWVVLTRDTRIRHRELERSAVETAKVGMLVLTARGDQSLATMVETMQKSTARLRKVLTGLKRPYIVHIMAGGAEVKVAWPPEPKAGEKGAAPP